MAGYKVVVLERGRRWDLRDDGRTFPPTLFPDGRSAWFSSHANLNNSLRFLPIAEYPGLVERISGRGLDAVFGAGVGGGSLVFGSFTPQPRRREWDQIFPVDIDYSEMDSVWFPLAKKELGVSPLPDDILGHPRYSGCRTWLDVVRASGGEFVRHDFAMDWDIVRDELAGRAVPSATVGEYVFGTNSGAKISLDRTYLARALDTGNTEIRPLTEVTGLGQLPDGRMRVGARILDEHNATVGTVSEDADLVVLAAGAFHSTELLLRWRQEGSLASLPDAVGANYGTNGDFLYAQVFPQSGFGPVQGGPGVGVYYDDDNPYGPTTISWEAAPIPLGLGDIATTNLMQIMTDQRGSVHWDAAQGRAVLDYPYPNGTSDADHIAQFSAGRFQELAYTRYRQFGRGIPVWTPLADLGSSTTWHSLGGTVMDGARVHGGAPGAVDHSGRVHGYPNLLVMGASTIPGTVGMVNPALTITALAERSIHRFISGE